MDGVLAGSQEILALARSKEPVDRENLLAAIAELCDRGGASCHSPDVQVLLQEIFMGLVTQAERDIRQRLAERLADAPWAPPALINILALDDIEIARPIIARSPLLKDHDLVRLLVEATLEHQIEVARRPNIGQPVVNAIIDQSQPAVLIALASNDTAELSPLAMQRLVVASQRIAALRGSLAQHPKLTADLAQALYGWVGEALRASISGRFTIDPAMLAGSVSEVAAEAADETSARTSNEVAEERAEMERRLVGKLKAADQLRPGYLLRALREGRLVRFEAALAALGDYRHRAVQAAVRAKSADLLALACAGVGIDRSVFPTILSLVRALNGGLPGAPADGVQSMNDVFARPAEEAAELFQSRAAAI